MILRTLLKLNFETLKIVGGLDDVLKTMAFSTPIALLMFFIGAKYFGAIAVIFAYVGISAFYWVLTVHLMLQNIEFSWLRLLSVSQKALVRGMLMLLVVCLAYYWCSFVHNIPPIQVLLAGCVSLMISYLVLYIWMPLDVEKQILFALQARLRRTT